MLINKEPAYVFARMLPPDAPELKPTRLNAPRMRNIFTYKDKSYEVLTHGSSAQCGGEGFQPQYEEQKIYNLNQHRPMYANTPGIVMGVALYVDHICRGFVPNTTPPAIEEVVQMAQKYIDASPSPDDFLLDREEFGL